MMNPHYCFQKRFIKKCSQAQTLGMQYSKQGVNVLKNTPTIIPGGLTSVMEISFISSRFTPHLKQNTTVIAAFGPTTAKAVKDAGLRLDVEAPTPEAPSMTAALEQYLKKESGNN